MGLSIYYVHILRQNLRLLPLCALFYITEIGKAY